MSRLPALLGFVALGIVMSLPSSASAHAELASSNPADGSSVQVMPGAVSLTLSEPVKAPAFIQVTGADGVRYNSFDVTVRDDTVTSAINRPAPAGTYTMEYRIVSADDHTVSGTITFDVQTGQTPTPTVAEPSTPAQEDPRAADGSVEITAASGESNGVQDALIVTGFSVVAMAALVMLLRAGLRSASSEDDDQP